MLCLSGARRAASGPGHSDFRQGFQALGRGSKLPGGLSGPGGGQSHLLLELLECVLAHRLLDGDLALDVLDTLARKIGGDAHPRPVLVDLVLNRLLGLAEVGREVEVELGGKLRHLRLGAAHLEVGIVLANLLLDVLELLDSVLDLEQVVAISLLMQGQLLLVFRLVFPGPFQIEGELGRGIAISRREIRLDLGFQGRDLLALPIHLPGHALDQRAILGQALAAFTQLVDRSVVLVLHFGDRIVAAEPVAQFVELCREGFPDFSQNHGSPVSELRGMSERHRYPSASPWLFPRIGCRRRPSDLPPREREGMAGSLAHQPRSAVSLDHEPEAVDGSDWVGVRLLDGGGAAALCPRADGVIASRIAAPAAAAAALPSPMPGPVEAELRRCSASICICRQNACCTATVWSWRTCWIAAPAVRMACS